MVAGHGNGVGESRGAGEVEGRQDVFADDAAALSHSEQAAGVDEVTVLETGNAFFDEFRKDVRLLASLDIHAREVFGVERAGVARVSEAHGDFVLAAVLRASGNVRHPVEVVVDWIRQIAGGDGFLDQLEPTRVGLLQLGFLITVPIDTAERNSSEQA